MWFCWLKWTREFWGIEGQSDIQTARLDFGRCDPVLLDLLIKRASRDAESLRGVLYAASLLLKYAFDVLLFEFEKSES